MRSLCASSSQAGPNFRVGRHLTWIAASSTTVHRKLVYRSLQFQKCSQLFIGVHDETISVAMCVSNPDQSVRDRSHCREQKMARRSVTELTIRWRFREGSASNRLGSGCLRISPDSVFSQDNRLESTKTCLPRLVSPDKSDVS